MPEEAKEEETTRVHLSDWLGSDTLFQGEMLEVLMFLILREGSKSFLWVIITPIITCSLF